MRFEQPDDDAYGRVTNPERYRVVADAAHALVAKLTTEYDVTVTSGTAAADFPAYRGSAESTTRIDPATGAPIRILITDFPGVVIRFGRWGDQAFPSCGCDACDEDPAELVAEMELLVHAVTGGRYVEELRRRTLTRRYSGPGGSRGSTRRLRRQEVNDYRPAGRHEWPAWPTAAPT